MLKKIGMALVAAVLISLGSAGTAQAAGRGGGGGFHGGGGGGFHGGASASFHGGGGGFRGGVVRAPVRSFGVSPARGFAAPVRAPFVRYPVRRGFAPAVRAPYAAGCYDAYGSWLPANACCPDGYGNLYACGGY